MKLIGELRDVLHFNHARGCRAADVLCKCGHDTKLEGTLKAATVKLEALTMALRYIADHKMSATVIREHALLALRDSQHHQVNK